MHNKKSIFKCTKYSRKWKYYWVKATVSLVVITVCLGKPHAKTRTKCRLDIVHFSYFLFLRSKQNKEKKMSSSRSRKTLHSPTFPLRGDAACWKIHPDYLCINKSTMSTGIYTNHIDSTNKENHFDSAQIHQRFNQLQAQAARLDTYKVDDNPSVREPARRFTEVSVSIRRRDPRERRWPTSSVRVWIAKVINCGELTGPGATLSDSGEEEWEGDSYKNSNSHFQPQLAPPLSISEASAICFGPNFINKPIRKPNATDNSYETVRTYWGAPLFGGVEKRDKFHLPFQVGSRCGIKPVVRRFYLTLVLDPQRKKRFCKVGSDQNWIFQRLMTRHG